MASAADPRAGDVQSLHRALDLLEEIARRGEMGVSALAREVGLKPSTTHNLLKTMTKRGYLLVTDGRYRLGPSVTAMTARFDPAVALPAIIRPAIQKASRATKINVLATVLINDRLQSIGWAESASLIYQVASPREEWDPAAVLDPAAGRVLVAFSDRARWPAFIDAATGVEPAWTSEDWERHLADIVDHGLCVKFDPKRYLALGVPVWSGAGVVMCSLACALPANMANSELMQSILDALWAATSEISSLLGCRDLPYDKPVLRPEQLSAVDDRSPGRP
ncbi:IclR family transcriptional regulator [Microlunatus soli]|uniref:DNA-binding transcriptional regulator, IclR family n=1 Tax=Microlunatus soli TaxID=630515 RepID=A0A1H1TWH7_9ACTN|nr:helix-turn-helix domain-containing protein [Microlunatus soli]SDS64266.1 DNA-binding transcriptional regulator, IclR family [Microlunatus soli]